MKKLEAKFLNLNSIQIVTDINSDFKIDETLLYCNDSEVVFSYDCNTNESEKSITYNLKIQSFLFGGEYYLLINKEQKVYVDVLPIMQGKIIDDKFFYDGNDLGFTYNPKYTVFKLWSPLASAAFVKIIDRRSEEYQMTRKEKGVFEVTLKGNLDKTKYLFGVVVNGKKRYSTDPWGIASTPNSKESVVIDLNKTYKAKAEVLPLLEKYTDAVIYETSVRDLTSYANTDVVNKGKFLGVVEEDRKSSNGVDVGLAHLKRLGITHLQVLPIYDFGTVDELNPTVKYNWGYDPVQYNVPEGSYATNVKDPYSRVNELKEMVDKLHANGIKVVMDVVYNHMYDQKTSPFEMIAPNYFFRRNADGTLSNGSFCGNEFATERKMCSKFIVDSTNYWVKEYGIDGFRFDLMGLIDYETINKVYSSCKGLKEDIIIYGEGWDMPSVYPNSKRATIYNNEKCPTIGHFNDVYRNIVKGSSFADQPSKGYLTGQDDFIEGFKYCFMGCVTDYCYSPKFLNANQSINYVECHDNGTIYDKVDSIFKLDSPREKQKRVSLINQIVILSYGVPFIHMGQECGLSKFGEDNTYNMGDRYNQYDYSILEDRKWMVKSLKDCIKIRKEYKFLRLNKGDDIKKIIQFENIDNGGLIINYINKEDIAPYKEFKVIINPSKKTTYYDLKDYYQVIYNEAGILKDEMYSQSLMVNPLTLVIVAKK